jgi:hypothetical protein
MWTPPNCFTTPTTTTVMPVCTSTCLHEHLRGQEAPVAFAVQLPLHEAVQAGAQQHLNLSGCVRVRSRASLGLM